jgi:hypothetical protein
MRWLQNQRYAVASIRNFVNALPELVRRLQRKGVNSLAQVNRDELQAARIYYRSRKSDVSCAGCVLIRFLDEQGIVHEGEPRYLRQRSWNWITLPNIYTTSEGSA